MCEHFNFYVAAKVARLTDGDDGPVVGFMAELKVYCQDCGMPFEFIGLQGGYSNYSPRVSPDNIELRAPIRPQPKAPFRELPKQPDYVHN